MNRTIKNRGIYRPEMVYFCDTFADKLETSDAAMVETIKNIIAEHSATMFTWYDGSEKRRVIVYNFADIYGERRAGYFSNGTPTHHINNIDMAIDDIMRVTMDTDIYIKAV